MKTEQVKDFLASRGFLQHYMQFAVSSATVELAAQAVIGNGIAGNYVAQGTVFTQHGAARERYVPQSVGTERHEAFGKQRQLGFAVGKHYSVGYVEVTAVEVAVIVKRGLGLEQMHKAEECFPELPLVLTIQYGNVFQRVQGGFAYGAFRIGVEEVAFPPGAYIYFPACLEQCDERIGIIAPQVFVIGLNALQDRPGVYTDANGKQQIGIRKILPICCTFDHRAVDFGQLLPFQDRIAEIIANPQEIDKWV